MPTKEQYWRNPSLVIERNTLWNFNHPEKRKLYNQHWRWRHYTDALLKGRANSRRALDATLNTAENNYQVWVMDEIDELKRLAKEYTMVETAIILGRTFCAVHYKSGQCKIKFRKPSKFIEE